MAAKEPIKLTAAENRHLFMELILLRVLYSVLVCGLFSGGQNEVGEVLEHPVVLEGVVDDSQGFTGQSDVGLASTAPAAEYVDKVDRWRTIGASALRDCWANVGKDQLNNRTSQIKVFLLGIRGSCFQPSLGLMFFLA